MSEENVALIQHWFEEVWNNRRVYLIEELLAEDSIAHGLTDIAGNIPRGHEGFKQLFYALTSAFPNLKIIVEDIISENDNVVARCTVKGTHRGDGLGVAPTDKLVEFTGLCMMRVKEGRIAEAWNQFDFMDMYQQIGALSLTLG
jgi:steroid delta-isomerase-like uncharacterized protein